MQAPAGYDLYTEVRKHDVLLAYPYLSIRPFIKMLLRAGADPDVVSIKMTLYRMARIAGAQPPACGAFSAARS